MAPGTAIDHVRLDPCCSNDSRLRTSTLPRQLRKKRSPGDWRVSRSGGLSKNIIPRMERLIAARDTLPHFSPRRFGSLRSTIESD